MDKTDALEYPSASKKSATPNCHLPCQVLAYE